MVTSMDIMLRATAIRAGSASKGLAVRGELLRSPWFGQMILMPGQNPGLGPDGSVLFDRCAQRICKVGGKGGVQTDVSAVAAIEIDADLTFPSHFTAPEIMDL